MPSITSLEFAERSFLFAKLSALAYNNDLDEVKQIAKDEHGFTQVEYYNTDGAQAYRFTNRTDTVIACRGTEPTCLNDIKADLRAYPIKSETVSRVHCGFKQEVDDLWPQIVEDICSKKQVKRKLWFTGHSLGGGMAIIMAARCEHTDKLRDAEEVYTYGSPRVGWPGFIHEMSNVIHHRWVNNNDIVARAPFWIMGYRHHGIKHYISSNGSVVKMTTFTRLKDKLKGLILGILNLQIDFFSDHSIEYYIKHIEDYKNKGRTE